MSKRSVLVVEDEPNLAGVLVEYLAQAGFEPHWIDDGVQAVDFVRERSPHLMVLDLMLPGKDGIEICRETRVFSDVPIIMATARIDEIDRLIGLEIGADDYLCKPYSPRELVARIRAIFRRIDFVHAGSATSRSGSDADGDEAGGTVVLGLVIDDPGMLATFRDHRLELTPVEFRLLKCFVAAPGRVFSRAQLLDRLYDDHRVVTDRTVDSHVKNLRRKLAEADPDRELIKSIYGVGYKLDP